ncbi:hypothetical protein GJ744_007333 [Endocarpon pusillum]|uniref:Uncharacterized protein n=1 Tax=Endocarpon pusillum TaxID=364733 RepID=A0A8H7AKU3_9EURO|nr:hypothetical protein GJ744_007333 [Endocarpon pusillum]
MSIWWWREVVLDCISNLELACEGDKIDSKRIQGEGRFIEVRDGGVGEPMGQVLEGCLGFWLGCANFKA